MELTGGNEDNPRPSAAPSEAEVESLRLQVEQSEGGARRTPGPTGGPARAACSRQHLRRSLDGSPGRLSCVLIFLSVMTAWLHQTVLDTDGFVAAVGPGRRPSQCHAGYERPADGPRFSRPSTSSTK